MKLKKEITDKLKLALAKYLSGSPDMVIDPPYDLRNLASNQQFLPVLYDMGGCLVITIDGQFMWLDWEPPHRLKCESDPRIIRTVCYMASQKYSELTELTPQRPNVAVDCHKCNGTGKCVPDSISKNYVCYCGGLGWLLPSD